MKRERKSEPRRRLVTQTTMPALTSGSPNEAERRGLDQTTSRAKAAISSQIGMRLSPLGMLCTWVVGLPNVEVKVKTAGCQWFGFRAN